MEVDHLNPTSEMVVAQTARWEQVGRPRAVGTLASPIERLPLTQVLQELERKQIEHPTIPFSSEQLSSEEEQACLEQQARTRKYREVLREAGVPPLYATASLSENCQRYADDADKENALVRATELAQHGFVMQRNRDRFCLLLSGDFGTGKTWLATATFKERLWRLIASGKKPEGLWRPFYSFIREVQETYEGGSTGAVLKHYQSVPVLLLDDVGDLERAEETHNRKQLLYEILDHRNMWLLPTIMTTNLSGDNLGEQFGGRIMQRIVEMSALVTMNGANLRIC